MWVMDAEQEKFDCEKRVMEAELAKGREAHPTNLKRVMMADELERKKMNQIALLAPALRFKSCEAL